jgi:hypothetical protein
MRQLGNDMSGEMRKMKLWAGLGLLALGITAKVHSQEAWNFIPDGFPTNDLTYTGNNTFTSPTYGTFTVDPNVENKVNHTLLGPLVWSYDDATKIATLASEWWGPLMTALPGEQSSLGINFPYVRSEYTSSVYYVELETALDAPFYNHNVREDQTVIGWQAAIGIGLQDARSQYIAAEQQVTAMQQAVHQMRLSRDALAGTSVQNGMQAADIHRAAIIAQFETMDGYYGRYLFHHQRTSRAWVFVQSQGGSDEQIVEAQSWISRLDGLTDLALSVYLEGQQVLYNQTEPLYATLLGQWTAIQAAQQAAAQQPSPPSTPSSGGATPPSGGSSNPTTPIVVAGDAISWSQVDLVGRGATSGIQGFNVSATLRAMNPHWDNHFGPQSWYFRVEIDGSTAWQNYAPYDDGNAITGNMWIFVPQGNGRYWATAFEGYRNTQSIHAGGNLNFDHTNVLAGTPMAAPWQPQSGVQYGWMISTNVMWPGRNGDQRSTIILQAWP